MGGGILVTLGSVGKGFFPTEPNATNDPADDPAKQNKQPSFPKIYIIVISSFFFGDW